MSKYVERIAKIKEELLAMAKEVKPTFDLNQPTDEDAEFGEDEYEVDSKLRELENIYSTIDLFLNDFTASITMHEGLLPSRSTNCTRDGIIEMPCDRCGFCVGPTCTEFGE